LQMLKADAKLTISDVLLEALAPSQDDNPTKRTSVSFIEFMHHLPRAMNLTELTVCMKNSLQSEKVSEVSSLEMLTAICKHMGRFEIPTKSIEWWKTVADDFETVLLRLWSSEANKSSSARESFLITHRDSLSPFLDQVVLRIMKNSIVAQTLPDKDITRTLMSSALGQKLFKLETTKIEKLNFDESADPAIEDAEFYNFAPEEMETFYAKMRRGVEAMVKAGHKAFHASSETLKIDWLGSMIDSPIAGLQDRWSRPMAARMKAIALSNGSSQRRMARMPRFVTCQNS